MIEDKDTSMCEVESAKGELGHCTSAKCSNKC